jgi:hypothetical protein
MDLLLRLPDGKVVVIDRKCGPLRRDCLGAKAAEYQGQVQAYREILRAQGVEVQDAWIHFPLAGAMICMH